MFQRLYELSTILPQDLVTWEKLNEGMPPEYNRGFALCFDEQGHWAKIQTVQKTGKEVVYRAGSSGNGTNLTPCYKLSPTTLKRLLESVEELADNSAGTESDWLKASIESYKQNQAIVSEKLEKAKENAGLNNKDVRGFVFWARLLSNGQIDPVYNWNIAKQFLEQRFFGSLTKRGGKRNPGICIISGKTDQEVYGGFSNIACYNLDKPGSIAGGFSEKLAYRNFPVSKESAVEVAYAFTYAKDYLQGTMAGETYLILPYAVNPDIREQLHDHLREYPERFQLGKAKDLVAEESELVDEFGNSSDQIAFFLVFYEEKQASWKIQAEIQELLPSRLHRLKAAREKIEKALDLTKEGETKGLTISALTFKNFTSKPFASKKEIKNTLRNWLVALFEGRTVDSRHFLHHLVDKLVATGKGKETRKYLTNTTREALGLYRYALLTGLIMTERKTMVDLPEFNSVYGRYIHEHLDFFTKPEFVTAFLSGCYVSVTASVQKKERTLESKEDTSIVKKFLGKLLSKKNLIQLDKDAHDKLAYYSKNKLKYHATVLGEDLYQSWVACGQNWNISNEETTFAFTIGYSLQYRISQPYTESTTDTTEE
ncbi:MAG: hypothetical protein BWK79_17590 [Beggiatoa sp. IS2]|nr:MAG: hypothetical protein BWK79_17590 [Beggiatoa sp. IS2]